MKITLTDLPLKIQQQIPMSIRSFKNVYDIEELPPRQRDLIREYLVNVVDVEYNKVFDIRPTISKYSDFTTLTTVKSTIAEYLRNYFYTLPTDYPFDPAFGCKLKYYLQTRDTELRKTLIGQEINNIVGVLSADLKLPITVDKVTIIPQDNLISTSYDIVVAITVNGESQISINLEELK